MRGRLIIAVLLAVGLIAPGSLTAEAASANQFVGATASLSDSNPNDGMNVTGAASLRAQLRSRNIQVRLRVEGLAPNGVYAWHIHLGTCEIQGRIAINPGGGKDLRANSRGVATINTVLPDRPPVGASILTNGAPYYINVHALSTKNGIGGGITCGNLSTNGTTNLITTELTGEAEVNAAGDPNQGDLDGSGTARVQIGATFVCFDLSVQDIKLPASASHIHRAPAGSNGGIVVDFIAPDANGKASGCITVPNFRDPSAIDGLRNNPAGFYVNVHNSDFPPGALRGQLG
jgi:hypothetical protein